MEKVKHISFEAIIVSDNWTILSYKDKYYVADVDGLFEVELKYSKPFKAYSNTLIKKPKIILCDYIGYIDGYVLGFDRKPNWEKLYNDLNKYVEDMYDDFG